MRRSLRPVSRQDDTDTDVSRFEPHTKEAAFPDHKFDYKSLVKQIGDDGNVNSGQLLPSLFSQCDLIPPELRSDIIMCFKSSVSESFAQYLVSNPVSLRTLLGTLPTARALENARTQDIRRASVFDKFRIHPAGMSETDKQSLDHLLVAISRKINKPALNSEGQPKDLCLINPAETSMNWTTQNSTLDVKSIFVSGGNQSSKKPRSMMSPFQGVLNQCRREGDCLKNNFQRVLRAMYAAQPDHKRTIPLSTMEDIILKDPSGGNGDVEISSLSSPRGLDMPSRNGAFLGRLEVGENDKDFVICELSGAHRAQLNLNSLIACNVAHLRIGQMVITFGALTPTLDLPILECLYLCGAQRPETIRHVESNPCAALENVKRIMFACGPFTDPRSLKFMRLDYILESIYNVAYGPLPRILCLLGPFVPVAHPMLASPFLSASPVEGSDGPQIPMSFRDLQSALLDRIRNSKLARAGTTQIVIIPNSDDLAHPEPFPQPPFRSEESTNNSATILSSNPCILQISGKKMLITSEDVVTSMEKMIIPSRPATSSPPLPAPGVSLDDICQHLYQSNSLTPWVFCRTSSDSANRQFDISGSPPGISIDVVKAASFLKLSSINCVVSQSKSDVPHGISFTEEKSQSLVNLDPKQISVIHV